MPSGAVNAGNLRSAITAVIYGVGGSGYQRGPGRDRAAGCKYVVVVDRWLSSARPRSPGATHAFADAASAAAKVDELT